MPRRGDGNRQDNRQRGNAAQLLEKYKSMARDAQLAGDRVQTEYFLQFADHYFRVLGDSRVRFEEQRRQRGDDGDGDDDEGEEMAEAQAEAESDERPQRGRGRDRDDRPEQRERPERPDPSQRGNGRARDEQAPAEVEERIPFDVLPPAIGGDERPVQDEEEAPRPRRRVRRPRAEDGDEEIAPAA
jgi:hypothetical protein